jgi:anti-sigma regulatory factor (Ser/Thr protein kinase)
MPAPPLLTAVPHHEHRSAAPLRTLVAVHGDPSAPPAVIELAADEPALLIEAVFETAAAESDLPVLAVREAVENLVHAGFADAVVSVLDQGRTLRLADHGPGVRDVALALTPGFSTAGAAERAVIRGVGSGLPLAARAMSDAGGELRIEPNLGGGLVVTLAGPPKDPGGSDLGPTAGLEGAQALLALLLELGPSGVVTLADELDRSVSSCGRALALLEQRGLVARERDGARSLTEAGARAVSTLF